jgi:hypothetical protein
MNLEIKGLGPVRAVPRFRRLKRRWTRKNFVENYQRCERAYAGGPAFEVMTPGSADYVPRYRGDPRIMTGMQDKSLGSFMEFVMTPGNVRIRRFQLNANARDFAVGDIHGHFVRFEVALAAVKFSPEKDRLFSVGTL